MFPGENGVLRYDETAEFYQTHMPDAKEAIRTTLYDSVTYAAAGQTSLQLFQNPKGQGGKTVADTNMTLAGQLPAGQAFLIEGISFICVPTANPTGTAAANNYLNDVYTFGKAGSLNLFISNKSYLDEAPLQKFPATVGLETGVALAVATTNANTDLYAKTQYAAWGGQFYDLSPAALMLVPTTNFSVTLSWPTALALPSNADMKIFCNLHGIMYRWIQ